MGDRQNRAGSRPGAGAPMSGQQADLARKERLRRIAMETIDLDKDPYFLRNHQGSFECKLCGTLHGNEGNYLAHTQGKRHQDGLAWRARRDDKDGAQAQGLRSQVQVKQTIKIGRPGYTVLKVIDPETQQKGLVFELVYPDIEPGMQPRHRIMSAFEQRVGPRDANYQYMLFAGEPYETLGFRVPNHPLERLTTDWNVETKTFKLQFFLAERK